MILNSFTSFRKFNETILCDNIEVDEYIIEYFKKHTCTDGMDIIDGEMYQTIIRWYIDGILHICICAVGFIANILSIHVLLSKKMRNLFNITLAILALFDAIYTLCDLLESLNAVYYSKGTCVEQPIFQKIHMNIFPQLYALRFISMMASIYTTIVISIERYAAVSKPMDSFVGYFEIVQGEWKNAMIYTLPAALFSIAFNLPKFFEFSVGSIEEMCPIDEVDESNGGEMLTQ
jgi:hypothetical protein